MTPWREVGRTSEGGRVFMAPAGTPPPVSRCDLSDLWTDQCACRRHRGDPGNVEQIDDLGHGSRTTSQASRIEFGACSDTVIARFRTLLAGECGMRGCTIRPGELVGRDISGVLVCQHCMTDEGGHGSRVPREPDPPVMAVPVPIPDLLERTRASVGGVTSREGASNE